MSESAKKQIENGAGRKGTGLARMNQQSVDETLRMIARMPAPEGLEERVKAGLKLAKKPGRVLAWRGERGAGSLGTENSWARSGWAKSGWARSAAAAAIALVVAGGGWGIYARVGPAQSAKAVALPGGKPGGAAQTGAFGEAGAMRRPLTLTGPVVRTVPQPTQKQVWATNEARDGNTRAVMKVRAAQPLQPAPAPIQ